MTTSNLEINKTKTRAISTNANHNEIIALGCKIEIRSQSSNKSRAYLTDKNNSRITENGKAIFQDFYDNRGQSVNPVTSRSGSHLDSAIAKLLEKAREIKWFVKA